MFRTCLLVACLVLTCLALSFFRQETRSPAIRDFRPSLQPGLTAAVAEGHVGYEGMDFIHQSATDDEVILLSRCEHPILRAHALEEMTHRPSFDHMKVMLEHLDDTAKVLVDHGEWGLVLRTVSDYMIECGRWRTARDKQKIIDEILRHHNTLRSAYTCLPNVDTPENYYGSLKAMVTRDIEFTVMEDALYALAKCRRAEDISLIKDILLRNTVMLTSRSFDLMQAFPDTAYMEVLQLYARRMGRLICYHQSVDPAVAFIRTLGAYRNDSCARLLKDLFLRAPLAHCNVDTNRLRCALVDAIQDNPCPAYGSLRDLIRPYWRLPSQAIEFPADTAVTVEPHRNDPEPIRWY